MAKKEPASESQSVVESFYFGDISGTVLFLDIDNSLQISAKLLPKGTYEFLKIVLLPLVKCVEEHFGYIVQIQGDGIVAVFGHDERSSPRHAELAVNCAIEAQSLVRELNPVKVNSNELLTTARIGICSGDMYATMMEVFGKYEYNIMGLTVNLASRLQEKCSDYKTNILLDQATNDYIQEKVLTRKLGMASINGNPGLLQVYEVLAPYGEHSNENLQRKMHYEKGLDYYKQKEWAEALSCFLRVGEDKAAYEMIKRCKRKISALKKPGEPQKKN